ncbi:3-hydroxyacyl-CoA dehydrogenase, partial [Asaia sp. W19]|uniref:3-hydroxyacyl-CoA dehydrogenase NAD-binding domain-containing protein n=2 Tax=Asaia TaxID=91914 RepID=UPI001003BC47
MSVQIIRSAAVIGAGYMGGGIAQSLAASGMKVTLADVSPEATQRSLERLLGEARDFEAQGLLTPGSYDRIMTNL